MCQGLQFLPTGITTSSPAAGRVFARGVPSCVGHCVSVLAIGLFSVLGAMSESRGWTMLLTLCKDLTVVEQVSGIRMTVATAQLLRAFLADVSRRRYGYELME